MLKIIAILRELKKDIEKDIEAEGIEVFGYINTAIEEVLEELESLQNKNCTCCKFFTKTGSYYGICAKDVNTTKNKDEWLSNVDFLCNRFEANKENI